MMLIALRECAAPHTMHRSVLSPEDLHACFETAVDTSSGSARYVEDCQICCQPIEFSPPS